MFRFYRRVKTPSRDRTRGGVIGNTTSRRLPPLIRNMCRRERLYGPIAVSIYRTMVSLALFYVFSSVVTL